MNIAAGHICPKDGRLVTATGDDGDDWLTGTCDTCGTLYEIATPRRLTKPLSGTRTAHDTAAQPPADTQWPASMAINVAEPARAAAPSPADAVAAKHDFPDEEPDLRPTTPLIAAKHGTVGLPNVTPAPSVAPAAAAPQIAVAPGTVKV